MNATLIRFPFSQHLSRTLFKTVYISASVYRCILINIISLDNNINFLLHRKRANLKAAKLISIYTIIFTTNLIGSSHPKPSNNNTPVIVCGENAVYDGDTQPDTSLQAHPTDGDYEQPAEYAQLDSSKRAPVDENYQSLNVEGYDQLQKNPNENVPQYTSLNMKKNDDKRTSEEPTYEEIP